MTIADLLLDADAYPEPVAFRPERWLDADPQARARMQQNFAIFGTGARQCIRMK